MTYSRSDGLPLRVARASFEAIEAVLSYVVVTYARNVLNQRRQFIGRRRALAQGGDRWIGWSELQGGPGGLLTSMIISPRWNPHAVQHCAGPLAIQRSLRVDATTASMSASSWVVSVYRAGVEVATLRSRERPDEGFRELPLEPGVYVVFVRYYDARDCGRCPALIVDGERRVEERAVETEAKAYASFMRQICNRSSPLYHFLHAHSYQALRWSEYLPEAFVSRTYLPYGNPGTVFLFGTVTRGARVLVEVAPDLLERGSVHLALFNRCGFPTLWQSVCLPEQLVGRVPEHGTYLVRVLGESNGSARSKVSVRVLSATE